MYRVQINAKSMRHCVRKALRISIATVYTLSCHHDPTKKKTMPMFDINTKAAGAMLHTGLGETHMSNFLSALELPTLHHKALKAREREITKSIHDVALGSCSDALQEESRKTMLLSPSEDALTFQDAMNLLEEENDSVDNNVSVPLTLKYDMGWQKRSSGRKYDSMSGVGIMIGDCSGKIVDYGVRSKSCRVCTVARNNGKETNKHSCHRNYSGSSRGMEADVAGEIVRRIEGSGVAKVGTLIMDEDSTTIARIRAELGRSIEKWSDISHIRKHLQAALYKLQTTHKCLSSAVIRYLLDECFTYAVYQNKGNVEKVRQALSAIVPHAFGDHSRCGSWCRFESEKDNYQHSYLPNGKDLCGERLKCGLLKIFQDLADNADKIAPCASTSACECVNNMVASKAPKAGHLSSSGSLNARVACAVSQKNEGNSYLSTVYESAGLSPGSRFSKHAARQDRKREYCKTYKSSIEYKKRKLNFDRIKTTEQRTNELREGKTYQSQVAAMLISQDDVEVIPATVSVPVYTAVDSNISDGCKFVYFDLETTSCSKLCDIIQVAAVCGVETFNRFVMPTVPIQDKVSDLTQIRIEGGKMYHKGSEVEAVPINDCMLEFVRWLQNVIEAKVILVAHNCKAFDASRLVRHVVASSIIEEFSQVVAGFADTLPLFRFLYKGQFRNFKQTTVVRGILKKEYDAHNAIEDAQVLQEVVEASRSTKKDLFAQSFSVSVVIQEIERSIARSQNEGSLEVLIRNKLCGAAMVGKIAASGLQLRHLLLAYRRKGEEGLVSLFGDKDINGHIRVTKSKRVISSVASYLSQQR